MKKYISILFGVMLFTFGNNISAFGGKGHMLITKSAIMNTRLLEKFPEEKREKLKENLLNSCNYPDKTWSSLFVLYKSHFINPNESFSALYEEDMYNGEHSNAFISMIDEYNKALMFWGSCKQVEAIEHLGCAIHYLQDMCCIAHEMSWKDNNWHFITMRHTSYEKSVDTYLENNFEKLIEKYKDFDFRNNDIQLENIAVANAVTCKNNFDNKYKSDKYKEIDIEEVGIAHKATCELIYLFFKEVLIKL